MNPNLSIGTKRKIKRRTSRWRNRGTSIGLSSLREFPPAQCGSGHTSINYFGWLRVGYPVQVWTTCLLSSFPTNQVETRSGHLDRPTWGHRAHEATLSRKAGHVQSLLVYLDSQH